MTPGRQLAWLFSVALLAGCDPVGLTADDPDDDAPSDTTNDEDGAIDVAFDTQPDGEGDTGDLADDPGGDGSDAAPDADAAADAVADVDAASDATADGDAAACTLPASSFPINEAMAVRLDTEPLVADPGQRGAGYFFGHAVAQSETDFAVGSPGTPNGRVQIFSGSPGAVAFSQVLTTGDADPSPPTSDNFGAGLALDGANLIALDVGVGGDGSAYSFAFTSTWGDGAVAATFTAHTLDRPPGLDLIGNDWLLGVPIEGRIALTELGGDTVTDAGDTGSALGASVALDGAWLIAGAPEQDGHGGARVYRQDITPLSGAELTPVPACDGQLFGHAVDLQGNHAVVGAPGSEGGGRAYFYERDADDWTLLFEIEPPTGSVSFGLAVAVDEGPPIRIAVGDPDTVLGGAVHLYEKRLEGWTHTPLSPPASRAAGDRFGWALDLRGDHLVIGAPHSDTDGEDAGSAYLVYWCRPMVHGVGCVFTCSDFTQNGTESDEDCGGACPPCFQGDHCNTPADCRPGLRCVSEECQP